MKAIALGVFGAALLASAAFAAPINATTISSAEVSNVDQVGLVCNEYYGRCWRTRGPRYVLRYYYDPSYFPGRGYNYYAGPGYYNRSATADQGSSFAAGSQEAKGRSYFVGEAGVTVSGLQHPLLRIGPSRRVTVTRGCPGPHTNRTYDVSTSLSHEVVYERLRLETRFSYPCTDECIT